MRTAAQAGQQRDAGQPERQPGQLREAEPRVIQPGVDAEQPQRHNKSPNEARGGSGESGSNGGALVSKSAQNLRGVMDFVAKQSQASAKEPKQSLEALLDGFGYAKQAAATLWVLPGLRTRAAYAMALAFPDRDYLRAHDASYTRRLARSTSLVVRARPR